MHQPLAAIRAWAAERLRLCKNLGTDPQIVEAIACAKEIEENFVLGVAGVKKKFSEDP